LREKTVGSGEDDANDDANANGVDIDANANDANANGVDIDGVFKDDAVENPTTDKCDTMKNDNPDNKAILDCCKAYPAKIKDLAPGSKEKEELWRRANLLCHPNRHADKDDAFVNGITEATANINEARNNLTPEQKAQADSAAQAKNEKDAADETRKNSNDDKTPKDAKPDFPYNLFTKLNDCDGDVCKSSFSTWWKNIFSYSIFKANQFIRRETRKRFKNDGKYSILTSDTSFYLLFVFYFIGGLILSSFSGFIYLINALSIEPIEVKNISGIFGNWNPYWWILFNFFLFGIIFIIMFVFSIITVIQYIINFTIKPIMNDQDDIKEILKCNVHTLILFFCLITVSSSSDYLDDISTLVMSLVTGLYFIRTAIIYLQG
jgi:hypothetical protein